MHSVRYFKVAKMAYISSILILFTASCSSPLPRKYLTPTLVVEQTVSTMLPSPTLQSKWFSPLTPTPTSTLFPLEATAKQIPSATPLSSDRFLEGAVVLEVLFDGTVVLQDLDSGYVRVLDHEKINIASDNRNNFIGWTRQGCGFYYQVIDIVEVDLRGNILRTVFSYKDFPYKNREDLIGNFVLSPSEERVAFLAGTGNRAEYYPHGYHYTNENLMVSQADGRGELYQVSQRGGAWHFSWSPDSNKIAYTDRDQKGIFQVYVAKWDGSDLVQVSDFRESDQVPYDLVWSPDNRYVMIGYLNDYNIWDIYIASADGSKEMIPIGGSDRFWWDSDAKAQIWKGSVISKIHPSDGSIINEIRDAPDGEQTFAALGISHQFGCFGFCFGMKESGFWIYNMDQNTVTRNALATEVDDVGFWVAAPDSFPGENKCQ